MSLRLLMTTDAIGGVWTYALELAEALADDEVETVLAVVGPAPDDAQRAAVARTPTIKLIETGLPIDWTCTAPAPVRAAGKAITRLAADERVDLIHHNVPALAVAASALPSIAVAHGCVATWWQGARSGAIPPELAWHRRLMREGLAAVDRVMAPSASYAAQVAATYRLAALPTVVHNGRSATISDHRSSGEGEMSHAFTAGRLWDEVKNTPFLDRVAARLPLPFHAAGALSAPQGDRVAPEHLVTLGRIDPADLDRRLADRPIFVSAASFEPFGLAVLEAAQHGCPLVLSDIATFRELWDGAALFLPLDGDADAWADAIAALAADPVRRAALGEAARSRASRYTPAATASAMRAIYADVLANARAQVAA